MTERDLDDIALDTLFDTARGLAPQPGDDLMARILADAASVQPVARSAVHHDDRPPAGPGKSGWRGLYAAIGGWPAMGGMALAGLTGLWIGISPPASLTSFTSGILGETLSLPLYPDDDALGLLEG